MPLIIIKILYIILQLYLLSMEYVEVWEGRRYPPYKNYEVLNIVTYPESYDVVRETMNNKHHIPGVGGKTYHKPQNAKLMVCVGLSQ